MVALRAVEDERGLQARRLEKAPTPSVSSIRQGRMVDGVKDRSTKYRRATRNIGDLSSDAMFGWRAQFFDLRRHPGRKSGENAGMCVASLAMRKLQRNRLHITKLEG